MKFKRKIIPDSNYTPNFITKKRLHEDEINFDKLKDLYDERFKRMWEYYLLMCAGTFRSRRNQLWQLVMSKDGLKGGYAYKNNPRFD